MPPSSTRSIPHCHDSLLQRHLMVRQAPHALGLGANSTGLGTTKLKTRASEAWKALYHESQ